ncbi:MAG: hypothetical protein KIS95_10185 [Anaerolineae bacterium]|nr:hypothetical protein [Anaerolineae bacterium]
MGGFDSIPEAALMHYGKAFQFKIAEQYADAAGEALLAIKASPVPFLAAERLLASSYLAGGGSHDDGIKQLEKLTKLDPDDAGNWLRYAFHSRLKRDALFETAKEFKSAGMHREADGYFKRSKKAFEQARSRYTAFLNNYPDADAIIETIEQPLVVGDYIAEHETMDIQEAKFWYQTAANYDVSGLMTRLANSDLVSGDVSEVQAELENLRATAERKLALLENSTSANKPRNKFVERSMNQKLLINVAIAAIVFLLLCWGLYALIT